MTAPLKWRSQLCPCGFCPDGTRVEWRYTIDIRFRPRQKDRGWYTGSDGLRHYKANPDLVKEEAR